jgi:hypothetical protein
MSPRCRHGNQENECALCDTNRDIREAIASARPQDFEIDQLQLQERVLRFDTDTRGDVHLVLKATGTLCDPSTTHVRLIGPAEAFLVFDNTVRKEMLDLFMSMGPHHADGSTLTREDVLEEMKKIGELLT